MDELICASLFHTHYWYEVDMLKVPANILILIDVFVPLSHNSSTAV